VQNEPVVGAVQILRRRDAHELSFGLSRRLGGGEACAVGDAEHMRVDGDRAFAEDFHQHHIGGFPPDAGQCLQRGPISRHFPAVHFQQRLRERDHVLGLVAPEADGPDVRGEAGFAELEHLCRRVGDPKKRAGGAVDSLVRGLRRQHHRNQQSVRVGVGKFRSWLRPDFGQARIEHLCLGFGQALGHVRRSLGVCRCADILGG